MLQKTSIVRSSEPSISELDFSLNAFRQQKVLTDDEAYAKMLNRLIMMKKGTYPSEPNMGIDLPGYRFRDLDTILAGTLKETMLQQISEYIPSISIEDITISKYAYQGEFILFIDVAFTSTRRTSVLFSYMQKGNLITSSEIKIKKQKMINVQEEDN